MIPSPPAVPPPHAGMSKLSASTGSRPARTSRDVGPLATDQMSIAATNSGTASATAGVASAEASSRPTAAARIASGTLASAPTPARFSTATTTAAPASDRHLHLLRPPRGQQARDRRGDEQQPDPVGDEERRVTVAEIGQRRGDREVRGRQQRDRQ